MSNRARKVAARKSRAASSIPARSRAGRSPLRSGEGTSARVSPSSSQASARQSAGSTTPGATNAPWTPAAGEVGIRVRMYRVGFGDFFLVTFLDESRKPLHVIIDCGVFKGTGQEGDIGTLEAAVDDMVRTTGREVALIVMTHRHADHIAGFARHADVFKTLKVGGVWMPIWESEYEPAAAKFQHELTRTAAGLRQHFTALGADASAGQVTARKYMENALGELGVAGAARTGSNAVALDLLKRGFGAVTPAYYKAGDQAKLPEELKKAGLACKILGPPPVTAEALMKLMDLQKNVGQYLAKGGGEEGHETAPFGPEWNVEPSDAGTEDGASAYPNDAFREWAEDGKTRSWGKVSASKADAAKRRLEAELQQSLPVAAITAAKQLNAFLNNQSLVVHFTFKEKSLLFVGDAQAGNWEHWLFETDTPDRKGTGAIKKGALDILTSLDFYKVGHHGSGNATPKVAADAMAARSRKFACMCSTEAGVYGTENPDDSTKGTEVPRGPLLEKLESNSAFVRSDQIKAILRGGQTAKTIAPKVDMPLPPSPPGGRFVQGDFWVDCYL